MVRAWKEIASFVGRPIACFGMQVSLVACMQPSSTLVMSTILSHFGGLDELIQVIYQGADRFVALSQVTESAWLVYLGLKGPEGRWWKGSWSAQHISKITVRGWVV